MNSDEEGWDILRLVATYIGGGPFNLLRTFVPEHVVAAACTASSFSSLTGPLLAHVLSYAPTLRDACSCARVCRAWYVAAYDEKWCMLFWKRHMERVFINAKVPLTLMTNPFLLPYLRTYQRMFWLHVNKGVDRVGQCVFLRMPGNFCMVYTFHPVTNTLCSIVLCSYVGHDMTIAVSRSNVHIGKLVVCSDGCPNETGIVSYSRNNGVTSISYTNGDSYQGCTQNGLPHGDGRWIIQGSVIEGKQVAYEGELRVPTKRLKS